MAYQNLLAFEEGKSVATPVSEKKKSAGKKPSGGKPRGCDVCPLNKIKGLKKIINQDQLKGRKIMIWTQTPGFEENKQGKELVGDAGDFLWKHFAKVGISREDCDIQYAVRCMPVAENEFGQWVTRPPAKEEVHACSEYTDKALEILNGRPRVHLVLGQVAAKQLLRGEYRKDQKTFFSEKLKAWVILTYHPNYFSAGAPESKLNEFKEALRTIKEKMVGRVGKYDYVKALDARICRSKNIKHDLKEKIEAHAAERKTVVVDIEDGYDKKGRNKITYVGFCWDPKFTVGLLMDHISTKGKKPSKEKLEFLIWFFENKNILKTFHHGVYDKWKIEKLLRCRVRGFVHDTEYSEYIRFSWAKAYGLAAIADRRFRDFAGYKTILDEYRDKETGLVNFYELPLEILRVYNGADCILTKKIEISNKPHTNKALMKLMVNCAPVLARMEMRGPWLDQEHADLLDRWIPLELDRELKELQTMTGDKKFNPGAPLQVSAFIYDNLRLHKRLPTEVLEKFKKRSTCEGIMLLFGAFHKFPSKVLSYRKLLKKKTTYMDAYRKSAGLHGGRVSTKWWLTGTITNRLRSSGGKEKEAGLTNLQNIHGAEEIECLLVSDTQWRRVYKRWRKNRKEGK